MVGGAEGSLWLLEHDPVITLGRRGGEVDRAAAAGAGFAVEQADRGGLATCHEPGQLVGYLVADVRRPGIRRVVEGLERGLAAWLAGVGVEAGPREGYPGVWVGRDKIAAVGLSVRHGVTTHGFALNLVNDLRGFDLILPCGIRDGGVTTLARLRGGASPPEASWRVIADAVLDALPALR